MQSKFQHFHRMCLCVFSVGKAVELNKQRSPKQVSQPAPGVIEQPESPPSNSGRIRGSQQSEGSDTLPSTTSPMQNSPISQTSDASGQDSDCSKKTHQKSEYNHNNNKLACYLTMT